MTDLTSLGVDAMTGKSVLVQRGGAMEGAATLQAATALHAVVDTILEAGQATDAELAVFVPVLADALGNVLALVTPVDERAGVAAAVAMWDAMRSAQR
ncbi:hypothetical protein [Streptomyces griseoflavus]|uniref:hypothetical protein n=1 Tax=Streptomyces griseoflavus TaxID=35619 RepID=UPI0001B4E2EB|nr:hypothetical protein [Streptomyces griseoflavus]